MKSKRIATAVVATTLFASSTVAFAQSSSGKKAVEKMTCEDFVGLEDSFKPDAVYWAIAYGEDGKPESAGVSVEGIERMVPVIVEACQTTPKQSFWQKVKADLLQSWIHGECPAASHRRAGQLSPPASDLVVG